MAAKEAAAAATVTSRLRLLRQSWHSFPSTSSVLPAEAERALLSAHVAGSRAEWYTSLGTQVARAPMLRKRKPAGSSECQIYRVRIETGNLGEEDASEGRIRSTVVIDTALWTKLLQCGGGSRRRQRYVPCLLDLLARREASHSGKQHSYMVTRS